MDTVTSWYLGCTEPEPGTLTGFLRVTIYIKVYPRLAFIQQIFECPSDALAWDIEWHENQIQCPLPRISESIQGDRY